MCGQAVQLERFVDFGQDADEIIEFFFFGLGISLDESALLLLYALLLARYLGADLLHLRRDAGVLLRTILDIKFFV